MVRADVAAKRVLSLPGFAKSENGYSKLGNQA